MSRSIADGVSGIFFETIIFETIMEIVIPDNSRYFYTLFSAVLFIYVFIVYGSQCGECQLFYMDFICY